MTSESHEPSERNSEPEAPGAAQAADNVEVMDGDPPPTADDSLEPEAVAELDPLSAMTLQRDEIRAAAQQLQADFENYKKRVQRDQVALVERANERLLEELLPALDSFELAMGSLVEAETPELEMLTKGVALAVGQFRGAVERAGLVKIEAAGAPFDPEHHDAVLQSDGEGDPIVGEVLRTGYRLKSKVLRPAMVKVTRDN